MKSMRKISRGFSLITAVFLVVVVASLGALMVTFFAAQQQNSALDLLGSRAYQAANAGMEWGAFQITQSGVVVPPRVFAQNCQANTPGSSSVQVAGALSPYSVSVSCSATSAVEGTDSVWVYTITAIASGVSGAAPGSADYVERAITASIAASGVDAKIIHRRENY